MNDDRTSGERSNEADADRKRERVERRSQNLTRVLLAKAALDCVIVIWLAATFAHAAFARIGAAQIEKRGDELHGRFAASDASRDADVQLFIDGVFVAVSRARCEARNTERIARADASCEFDFKLPPLAASEHEASVYVASGNFSGARRVLRIVGEPVRFRIESSEAERTDASR